MTYLFDLNPVEQRGAFQTAAENATDIVNAPFFEGMGTGLVSGAKSAYYRQIYSSANPQTEADLQQNAIDQLQKLKPDPRSVGTAGQIMYNLSDVLGTVYAEFAQMPLMPTASLKSIATLSPSLLAIETGKTYSQSQKQLYIRQGIDPATAQSLAATDAAAVGLGVLLPAAVPGALTTRALSGGAINAVIGGGQRAAMSYELENAGYADLARQYKVFDGASIVTDFALGAFFGGLMGPRPAPPEARGRVLPSDVDGTLTMNNAAHIETGTIPGMPTDLISRQAHVDAVSKALDDLMNGRPVDVGEQITRAPFEPKGESLLRQEMTVEVEQHLSQQLQSLKAELERRGLTTEDIDQTAPVTLRETTPGMPGSAAIKEVIPNAAVGGKTSVKIEGDYKDATWVIVDAKDVEATMAKAPNQFRDRYRAASQTQIEKIANAPDFNLLEASPLMDFGAPTMTKDGFIVGGNGRFAGVSKSYGRGTGEIYRGALRASLDKFGLKEADLVGKERPILVRVLDNPVDVVRTAIASNEGAGLRMSALEQAKVDSVRLGDITGMSVGDNGEVNLAANISYIQRWAGQFPETEQAALVDKNGRLSQEGEKRLRNAILFRAYGDSPTLERLVESTDPGARNVATALIRTAPRVAETKAAIDAGELYPLDISEDITAAVEKLDAIRSTGDKVADYLNQGELLGSELTPEARTILQFMGENLRSAKAMAEMIGGYYDRVEQAGNPLQGDMLGGQAPTKGELLTASINETRPLQTPGMAELPFEPYPTQKVNEVLNPSDLQRLPENQRDILAAMYDKAVETKPKFDAIGQEIARLVDAEYMAGPIKKSGRAVDKALGDYRGDVTKVRDLVRSTIIVDTPEQAAKVLDLISQRFSLMSEGFRNLLDESTDAPLGYRDAKMNVEFDGMVAEIQVNYREMLAAKDQFHDLYKQMSELERSIMNRPDQLATSEELARIAALKAEQKAGYDAAFAETIRRLNRSSETGAPLRRAESGSNGLGGETSQAAQYGTEPPAPMETGMPSTSKSSASLEKSISGTSRESIAGLMTDDNIALKTQETILSEKPDLTIADENGQQMPAAQALAQADAEIARAMQEAPGFDAAVSCALRNS